jgi:hypothetical protein
VARDLALWMRSFSQAFTAAAVIRSAAEIAVRAEPRALQSSGGQPDEAARPVQAGTGRNVTARGWTSGGRDLGR